MMMIGAQMMTQVYLMMFYNAVQRLSFLSATLSVVAAAVVVVWMLDEQSSCVEIQSSPRYAVKRTVNEVTLKKTRKTMLKEMIDVKVTEKENMSILMMNMMSTMMMVVLMFAKNNHLRVVQLEWMMMSRMTIVLVFVKKRMNMTLLYVSVLLCLSVQREHQLWKNKKKQ